MKVWGFLILLFATMLVSAPFCNAGAVGRFVSIGTGGVTGVYYPAGSAICRLVNKGRDLHGVRCSAESTRGSVANLNRIAAGDLELGVAQSDWQHHAYHGTAAFAASGPNEKLRSLFSLHSELFTVVTRADSGIRNFSDLAGKRVNIGNQGSGQRGTMEVVMAAYGWDKTVFSEVYELDSAKHSAALCRGQFDAMVFTVGHPSISIREATSSCATRLVEVTGTEIEQLLSRSDHYSQATIPGGLYRGSEQDILSFALYATFVTSETLPEAVAYNIVKAVFENFEDFRTQHPAFQTLQKEQMVSVGLTAPLHPGALKYYREVGLL